MREGGEGGGGGDGSEKLSASALHLHWKANRQTSQGLMCSIIYLSFILHWSIYSFFFHGNYSGNFTLIA